MARNLIPALLATAALAAGLAACGEKEETIGTSTTSPSPEFEIAGDWSGQLTQKGLKPFLVAVRIVNPSGEPNGPPGEREPSARSQVAYTGIDCGGDWVSNGQTASEPKIYSFTELITTGAGGNCKGGGAVTLTSNADAPDQLAYVFSGDGVRSSGALTKTDAAGIAPTFAQAGVTLSD